MLKVNCKVKSFSKNTWGYCNIFNDPVSHMREMILFCTSVPSLSLLRLYHHGSVVVTPYSPEPQDCYSDLETKCHCRTEESPCGWQCPWSQYRWYTHSHRHRLGHTVVCGWPHLEPLQPVTTQCQTMCVHMCMWVYIKMDAHTLRFCIRTHHLH